MLLHHKIQKYIRMQLSSCCTYGCSLQRLVCNYVYFFHSKMCSLSRATSQVTVLSLFPKEAACGVESAQPLASEGAT